MEQEPKKSFLNSKDSVEYGPDETVGSFGHKMQIEKEKIKREQYKPTEEEQKVIKILIAPILNKINELKEEASKITLKKDKIILDGKIGFLFRRLVQIKMPQQMSEKDIKNLITEVAEHMEHLYNYNKKYKTSSFSDRFEFLNLEINFLIDQLKKRMD